MDHELKSELHFAAVSWYRERNDSAADRIEFIHHLSLTGDDDALAEALLSEGRTLVKAGHTELLSILNDLDKNDFETRVWGMIRTLRGDILSIQGRWDEAEVEYDAATKHVSDSKDGVDLARLLSSRADIALKRGAMDDALELHRKALGIQILSLIHI